MPRPTFTEAELREILMAVRAQAHRARETAEKQKGSSMAGIAIRSADQFQRIADKCSAMLNAPPAPPDNVVRLKPGADHRCDKKGPSVEVAMEAPTCSVCGVPQVFD